MPTPIAAEAINVLPKAALAGLACEAAASGDKVGAQLLIDAGVSMSMGTPYDNRTPLHLAAAAGNLEMVRFLIEECGVSLERDRFGLTPINDAVHNGHAEVRRYLQSKRLERSARSRRFASRVRSDSIDSASDRMLMNELQEELMSTVFELIVKEGIFSYTTVFSEVQYFFKELGLHPMYFEHFTPLQVAKHIHCLIATKRVAQTTEDMGRMDFALTTERSGFFLTTIDMTLPTEAQKRTEAKVSKHLDAMWQGSFNASLTFMASEGPAIKGGHERLGIFTTENGLWEVSRFSEDETSIEVLGSSRFLKEKTRPAKEQYQIMMEDVVTSGRACIRIVPGSVYPGPYPGGYVLQFGTPETAGRHYFSEVFHAMRFCRLLPRRFYLETFANGVLTYSLFFPAASESEMHSLGKTIMCSTHLRVAKFGKGDVLYHSVMQAKISHEVGLYLAAAVKFVYAFFPKEQYAPEYMHVHHVLEKDPGAQRKLEALYKLCMRDLLSTDRIYELVSRQWELAAQFYEDFRSIATGASKPKFNAELQAAVDKACTEEQDRQILKMFLTFNESVLLTNFFKAETPGAMAFRLNPKVVLRGRPTSMYPEIPYAIYLVSGRTFMGFHVRFQDVARGGVRIVLSRDRTTHERNVATLFDECYNLALTQHMKNKDIPEGGAKAVILPDPEHPSKDAGPNAKAAEALAAAPTGGGWQSQTTQRACFMKYISALLDCMMPEDSGIFSGHMNGTPEILYFGPDENSAGFMDLGAEMGKQRGYPYWKALTTAKSVKYGGVPHDKYGMTTHSVRTYVLEMLRELGEEETSITKVQTGGPDGDLGSNEILVSKDKTIAIVDVSGVLYDPAGLRREELIKLAKRRRPVKDFPKSALGEGGFLVLCEDTDVELPDGSVWSTGTELRDNFIFTKYATADLFVPCGGRPNSVSTFNVDRLLCADGSRPKFRMVVEGANLFFSEAARDVLEKSGCHIFKDASANKGGVCSSSLEVFSALALPDLEHTELMTYDPDDSNLEPPEFYRTYVRQIIEIVEDNARQEFKAIWSCNQKEGVPKSECTRRLSVKINRLFDSIQEHIRKGMTPEERRQLVSSVLNKAVPPSVIDRLGLDVILQRVPENYIASLVAAWVSSRFVYRYGIDASEVAFFFFMRSLLAGDGRDAAKHAIGLGGVQRKRSAWENGCVPGGATATGAAAPASAAAVAEAAAAAASAPPQPPPAARRRLNSGAAHAVA